MVVVGGGASGRGVVVAEIKVLRIDSDQFRWISDVYNEHRNIKSVSNYLSIVEQGKLISF